MAAAPYTIRRATMSDQGVVRQISADAFIPAYAPLGYIPRPAEEDYADALARGEVWLLEANEEPAAVIVLQTEDHDLAVYVVAVRPVFQGRGYGRGLLDFAERHAIAVGADQLRLYTNERMSRNLSLYRACGYRETGRRRHPHRPGETLIDMAKRPTMRLGQ